MNDKKLAKWLSKNIVITTYLHKEDRRRFISPIVLTLNALGIWGILLCAESFPGIEFNQLLMIVLTAILIIILHSSYKYLNNKFKWIYFGTLLIIAIIIGSRYKYFWECLRAVINAFQTKLDIDQNELNTSLFMIVLALVVTEFVFTFEYIVPIHLILSIVILTMMITLITYNNEVSKIGAIYLIIYVFGMLAMTISQLSVKFELTSTREKLRLGAIASLFIVIIMIVASVVLVPIAIKSEESIYNTPSRIEQYINRQVHSNARYSIMDGSISRGNNYASGIPNLSVVAYSKPQQIIYLKGFTGGSYKNGKWEVADDSALIYSYLEENSKENDYKTFITYFNNMYYSINARFGEDVRAGKIMTVRPLLYFTNVFRPYYSMLLTNITYITTYMNAGLVPDYTFNYLEQYEIDTNLNELVQLDERYSYYKYVEDAYKDLMSSAYTNVEEANIPRLRALVKQNPQKSLNEISAFIIYTLHSNTEYTLTPGWGSIRLDPSEDFLFNRQKGYCVHYASTAALMYRLYGIPTRYAAGFAASPDKFIESSTSDDYTIYEAHLTDKDAHAWVEIYIDNYGWTPIEVTPSADGTIMISYPGFDEETFEEILSENDWDITKPSLEGAEDDEEDENKDNIGAFNLNKAIVYIILGLILIAVAIIIIKKYRTNKLNKSNSSQLYSEILKLLAVSDNKFFSEKYTEYLNEDEIKQFEYTIDRIKFSKQHIETEEDMKFIRDMYKKIYDTHYKKSKGFRKIFIDYYYKINFSR